MEATGFTKLFANPQPFSVEQWTIINESGGWFHPVHIHLIDAKIIARNTNGGKPFAWELGPKDVFYTGEGESVTALMQFNTQPDGEGKYMIHCHNLVHEDHDMMVQFSAGDPGRQRPHRLGPAGPATPRRWTPSRRCTGPGSRPGPEMSRALRLGAVLLLASALAGCTVGGHVHGRRRRRPPRLPHGPVRLRQPRPAPTWATAALR